MVRVLIPLLTIYAMYKMFDKAMAITDIHLMKKTAAGAGLICRQSSRHFVAQLIKHLTGSNRYYILYTNILHTKHG